MHFRRSRLGGRGHARQDEYARADDRTDAEQREVGGVEAALEPGVTIGVWIDRLGPEQAHAVSLWRRGGAPAGRARRAARRAAARRGRRGRAAAGGEGAGGGPN